MCAAASLNLGRKGRRREDARRRAEASVMGRCTRRRCALSPPKSRSRAVLLRPRCAASAGDVCPAADPRVATALGVVAKEVVQFAGRS
jgi:hypothetical protein